MTEPTDRYITIHSIYAALYGKPDEPWSPVLYEFQKAILCTEIGADDSISDEDLIKGFGHKDMSKLRKVIVTDKNGKRMTVYKKIEGSSEREKGLHKEYGAKYKDYSLDKLHSTKSMLEKKLVKAKARSSGSWHDADPFWRTTAQRLTIALKYIDKEIAKRSNVEQSNDELEQKRANDEGLKTRQRLSEKLFKKGDLVQQGRLSHAPIGSVVKPVGAYGTWEKVNKHKWSDGSGKLMTTRDLHRYCDGYSNFKGEYHILKRGKGAVT